MRGGRAHNVLEVPPHLHLASSSEGVPAVRAEARIRVVLAEDHAQLRDGLRLLLDRERDLEVLAAPCDLRSATIWVEDEPPDVVVLDLHPPNGSSAEAIGQLLERAPNAEIVVLTSEDSPLFAQRALTAGATGYVTRDVAENDLGAAIRAAARGEQYVSARTAAALEAVHRSLTKSALTPREVEVLQLIALGHTSVEIARKLHLSPRTVETHRGHIHKKLGLATRAQLVRYALGHGLLGARA
jgi:two-component system, NarL family, response regulator NreC